MPGTVDNKGIYHLGALIPLWTLQLICEILVISFSALGLAYWIYATNDEYCYQDYYGYSYCYNDYYDYYSNGFIGLAYGNFAAALALATIFLIMHITQIALFGRRKLTPAANFGIELARFIVWTFVTILIIVAIALGATSILVITFTVLLWLLYLGTMIYGSIIFHRSRRGRYNGSYGNNAAYPAVYQVEQPQHWGPAPYQQPPAGQQQYGGYQQSQSGQSQQPQAFAQVASPQPGNSQPSYPQQQTEFKA